MTMRRLLVLALLIGCGRSPELGSREAAMSMSPLAYDFGAVTVGGSSGARNFLITAAIDEDDFLTSITSSCAAFTVDTSSLAFPYNVYRYCEMDPRRRAPCDSQPATFSVTFTPSFAGPQSCAIQANFEFRAPLVSTVSGTGIAPPLAQQVIAPTDGTLAFGEVVVGTSSSDRSAILRNVGAEPIDVSDATLTGPDAAAFSVGPAGDNPLPAGSDYVWSLRCTPPAAGALAATLTLTTTAPTSPVVIALTCTGIQSDLTVTPSPLAFPEVFVGESATETLRLTNSGTAPLVFGTPTITGVGFTLGALSDSSIPAGESATIDVTFAPTAAEADQDIAGQVTLPFADGVRTIDLVGPARTADLALTPSTAVDFGTICVGQSRSQEFLAVNPGSGTTTLTDLAITGAGFEVAVVEPATLPAPLPPGGLAPVTFAVTAAPPVGPSTGTLTVTAGLAGLPPVTVELSATGVASGVAASPTAVDFGGVVVDEASIARIVRVDNCDAAEVAIDRLTVTGADAAQFVATPDVGASLPVAIAPGGAATFIVVMRPTTSGDKTATLELGQGAAATFVPLSGVGVGEDELPGDDPRGSYYACTTSRGGLGGALALGLGLALVLRRRRRR